MGRSMSTGNSSRASGQTSSLSAVSSFVHTHKRGSLFVFSAVTAASVIAVGVNAQSGPSEAPKQNSSVQAATETTQPETSLDDTSTASSGSSTSVNASVSTGVSGSTNNVQLNVNGQDIEVPQSGTTQQTVPNPDGTGQTSVNVTTNGDASNNSSSSLNVNVNSSSTSSSSTGFTSQSTIVTQNGGTTVVTSH